MAAYDTNVSSVNFSRLSAAADRSDKAWNKNNNNINGRFFFFITDILPWLPILLPAGIRAKLSSSKRNNIHVHNDGDGGATMIGEYAFYVYVADDRFRRINS